MIPILLPIAAALQPATTPEPPKDKPKEQLGATCAGCAGEARMLRDGGLYYDWRFSTRIFGKGERDWKTRYTFDRTISPSLSIGIEHNPSRNEFMPRFTWFVSPAKGELPSVTIGMTADRLSTPKGTAIFSTYSKSGFDNRLTYFASTKWDTGNNRMYFPFGGNINFSGGITLQGIYDGNYTHWLASFAKDQQTVSLVLARGRYLGLHSSIQF